MTCHKEKFYRNFFSLSSFIVCDMRKHYNVIITKRHFKISSALHFPFSFSSSLIAFSVDMSWRESWLGKLFYLRGMQVGNGTFVYKVTLWGSWIFLTWLKLFISDDELKEKRESLKILNISWPHLKMTLLIIFYMQHDLQLSRI